MAKGWTWKNKTLLQRFFDRVEFTDTCWLWTGPKVFGYGSFNYNYTGERAHRFIYRVFFGDFPNDLDVLHTCDNPPCVNAYHLFLGTQLENMRDMYNKGRSGPQIGTTKYYKGDEHWTHRMPERVHKMSSEEKEALSKRSQGNNYRWGTHVT